MIYGWPFLPLRDDKKKRKCFFFPPLMYEIAGLDKLIYDKKCRLVWNFVAANEIFILLFIIIIYLSLKYFFLKFSYQNSKYPIIGIILWYYLFHLFLSIVFSLKFKSYENLTNDYHQDYSNILYIYNRFIPIIHEIIKLSRAFVFKYLTRDIFWNSYTLFSFRVVGSFKN